jgi:chromosome partitioning protein
MSVVAIYNMKGGVGKTTTAVNLSYLAAASGRRTLIWDLDPQAASSFAFRVRPRVQGFRRKALQSGHAFLEAVKETDHLHLDLLPADFAYRKIDRHLDRFDRPQQVIVDLVAAVAHDYDAVFLDCPAGFTLLTEGILAASDVVLVPAIPTVLSLRTLTQLIDRLLRHESLPVLAAFLSMVDRRKALHRGASAWAASHRDLFLKSHVPYASIVEQMAVRRMPLAVFAPADPATSAFADLWSELLPCLDRRRSQAPSRAALEAMPRAIDALIAQLETSDECAGPRQDHIACSTTLPAAPIVHRFDTERHDFRRSGFALELREHAGGFSIVATYQGEAKAPPHVQVQIDARWAAQILSDVLSPLSALERRAGQPVPRLVEQMRSAAGDRRLRRTESRSEAGPSPQPVAVRRVVK